VAKLVFRPQEVVNLDKKVILKSPFEEEPTEVAVEPVEEYRGPSVDDLRREAEAFKLHFEEEKKAMMEEAKKQADAIIAEAESRAFAEVKRRTDEAERIRQEAEDEAKRITEEARRLSESQLKEMEQKVEEIRKTAFDEGYAKGREEGYESGKAEVNRLIEQLHTIIDKAIEKRNEIIEESETQIINLVLLIAKKVVKVISENQKNVVVNNVIQALRKLKSRGDVVIKVNLRDVELTSEHIKDFMRMVENVKSITVVEDSTVDVGGCIIETDFGEIDARISSQLHEIEEKILEISPIRARGEPEE